MKKILIIFSILFSSFLFGMDVKAAFVGGKPNFLGKELNDEWLMGSHSSITGPIEFFNTTNISTSSGSFAYIDICTTGYEPTLWITSNSEGSMSPSSKWYRVNMPCIINGYNADVYRQIIFISSSKYHDKCRMPDSSSSGDVIVPCTANYSSGTFFNNTDYSTYMRLIHFGISDSIPLQDLAFDNDLTQTDVLKEILEVLKSSNNNDITSAINNQTQKIENQIKEQEKTNQKLDSINDSINDDTPPSSDISGLGNVQGLLKPGPVDSLLNIPTEFLSVVVSSLGGQCKPLSGTWVYDQPLTFPCFDEIVWSNIKDETILNFVELIPCAFILMKYFKHLYKKVERATSMETNSDDEWGVI